jgi:branched-chain amino acid transport system permease protein
MARVHQVAAHPAPRAASPPIPSQGGVSWRPLGMAFAVALAVAAPWLFYPVLLMKLWCFALYACAFNLVLGRLGLLSLGHAAFLGSAAYACGLALRDWGWPPEAALGLAVAVATVLGAVLGALAVRCSGIYFAMITLALAQMVYFVVLQTPAWGGEDGLQGVPRGRLLGLFDLGQDRVLYALVATLSAGGLWLLHRIAHSPFGVVLSAIRDSEARATSLGYRVALYKWLCFVLSAALAGLAGALKCRVFGVATLSDVSFTTSGDAVLMALLGGLQTVLGPALGSTLLVLLQTVLADRLGAYVTVVAGALFVLCVLSFRRGLVGLIGAVATLLRRRPRGAPSSPSSIVSEHLS